MYLKIFIRPAHQYAATGVWRRFEIHGEFVELYHQFLMKNITLINDCVDTVLAVSDRVRDIAAEKGIFSKKLKTCYIGTRFADKQLGHSAMKHESDFLNIIYMGYARRDKGFYFLLESLMEMPDFYAGKINLHFAVGTDNQVDTMRIRMLCQKFNSVCFKKGYIHSELEQLLGNIHLGIVPNLWEDNLPQVAIEMMSLGVPLLTSDRGGASELHNKQQHFMFKAGCTKDFLEKLCYICDNRSVLLDYWKQAKRLVTMKEHIKELMSYYY